MKKLHVLVPLDGSKLSLAVLPYLKSLQPDQITLLHVVGPDKDLNESRNVFLESSVEQLQSQGLTVQRELRQGKPAEEILRTASQSGATLIAMSTHGRSGFDRFVLGSVTEKVLRMGKLPVLVLPTASPGTSEINLFHRVLLPYDGSPLAWKTVETLSQWGRPNDIELFFLGVVETWGSRKQLEERPDTDPIKKFFQLQEEEMSEILKQAASKAGQIGLKTSAEVVVGRPAEEILNAAEQKKASLLAMSTHGRSGPTRWVLGSVTEMVLRTTQIPLLVVR